MAIMTPDSCPSKASAGEKRLFRLFQDLLPDNFRVWYEPIIKGRYPDFVILADSFGLLILEVKGWYSKEILRVNDSEVERQITDSGQTHTEKASNPLRQVREYMFSLIDQLKQQPLLRNAEGDHQGKLKFPCGYGVLFSNIKRSEAEQAGWADVFPAGQVIFRDEMDSLESARNDRETIRRLRDMFLNDFPFDPLTNDQLKTIQGVLHKEAVVKSRPASSESMPAGQTVPEGASVLEVLDPKQETHAKSLGDGHRIIFGVAGSGKTLVLVVRAKLLASQDPAKRILILCYNRTLGTYIKDSFVRDQAFKNVEVFTFHAWARQLTKLRSYPDEKDNDYYRRVGAAMPQVTLNLADREKYDAILIDEAHDLEPDWLRCCVQALRTDPLGDLLIAVDGAQSLYGRSRSFTWKSVGVNAQGRSKQLSENYRNTREIIDLAWEVTQAPLADDPETETLVRVKPSAVVRSGSVPGFRPCRSEGEEHAFIVDLVRFFLKHGVPDRDICVLYPKAGGRRADTLFRSLQQTGSVAWLIDKLVRDRFMQMPGVRFSTIHSAKGLEFPVVILSAIDQLPDLRSQQLIEDSNLLYVGMTRATERLILTWAGDTVFTRRIAESGKVIELTRENMMNPTEPTK